MMDATMPLEVVRFQNSIMMMQGRLAEAATAKARPTRNETLTPWKAIPRRMAIAPTTKAAIRPRDHFLLVVLDQAAETVHEVVGDGAGGGDDEAAHGAEHGGEGDRRDHGEQERPERFRQERRRHVVVEDVHGGVRHGPETQEERQDVEEADGSDGDDRGLARRPLAGHGVVADEDVRQRGGTEEEGDHQGDEVDPVQQGAFDFESSGPV